MPIDKALLQPGENVLELLRAAGAKRLGHHTYKLDPAGSYELDGETVVFSLTAIYFAGPEFRWDLRGLDLPEGATNPIITPVTAEIITTLQADNQRIQDVINAPQPNRAQRRAAQSGRGRQKKAWWT